MHESESILPLSDTIAPADAQGVAAAIRDAHGSGTPVYPIGGGTSLGFGTRPTRPGLGLSLSAMHEIVDYPARDLTITVQAGTTVEALAAALARERQRLPVDVPQASKATVGGAVACAPSGPRRYAWGTLRDYVIGLTAVDGQGQVFSAGGRVVKNAAGYDLCRLLTGSLGTLAVVTQATLMVKPMPERSALVACDVPDFDAAERLLAGLVRSQTLPAAVELLAGPAWREDPALGPVADGTAARVVVGFEGTDVEVAWQVRQIQDEWRGAGGQGVVAIDASTTDGLWRRLVEFPAELAGGNGAASLVVRANVLPGQIAGLAGRLRQIDRGASLAAHAGSGVIVARLSMGPARCAAVLGEQIRPAVKSLGGHLVVLSAPAEAQLDGQSIWGPPPAGASIMRGIKDRFDPRGILNPGRFVYEQL